MFCFIFLVDGTKADFKRKKKLKEGDFHFDEFVEHLNNSPLVVNVHLDDTRIIHRIDYDSTRVELSVLGFLTL